MIEPALSACKSYPDIYNLPLNQIDRLHNRRVGELIACSGW